MSGRKHIIGVYITDGEDADTMATLDIIDILPSLKAGDSRFLVGGFAFRGDRSPSGCALRRD